MFALSYKNRKEEFEKLDMKEIKAKFEIPERKNLYRVNDKGELEKIEQGTIDKKVKNNDQLDALSDFTLG